MKNKLLKFALSFLGITTAATPAVAINSCSDNTQYEVIYSTNQNLNFLNKNLEISLNKNNQHLTNLT